MLNGPETNVICLKTYRQNKLANDVIKADQPLSGQIQHLIESLRKMADLYQKQMPGTR